MIQELENGNIVRLGNIGNFQIGITSTGSETPKAVTATKITKAKVNFRSGKSFNKMLKNLEYKKMK